MSTPKVLLCEGIPLEISDSNKTETNLEAKT